MGKDKRRIQQIVIRKAKKQEKNLSEKGPNDTVGAYNGPLLVPRAIRQIDETCRNLCAAAAATSTGGGVYDGVYSSDPTSLTDWASISGEYDEYRVLAIEVKFLPYNRYNQTVAVAYALSNGVGFVVLDMNNTTALTSVQNASQYASAKFISSSDPWQHEVKAATRNLMTWQPTSSQPTYFMAIKHYITGINVSTAFGVIWVRYLIQFRGTTD